MGAFSKLLLGAMSLPLPRAGDGTGRVGTGKIGLRVLGPPLLGEQQASPVPSRSNIVRLRLRLRSHMAAVAQAPLGASNRVRF